MAIEFKPHGYQIRGMQTLLNGPGGGMLLDPGMGKTGTALMAFEILREAGYVKTMLVIAPIKPMYDTWPREIAKWAQTRHLRLVMLHGKDKFKALDKPGDIYIINPEGVAWLSKNIARFTLPDVLCVDESTKFKNATSKRFKLLRKYVPHFKYRWILTGTVVPNGLQDLFGQAFIMDQGDALGKFVTHYRKRWFEYDPYSRKHTPHEGAYEEICGAIEHMVLKLDAEDYLQMPPLINVTRPVILPEQALAQYKRVEELFFASVREGTIVAANRAAAGTKCRQMANGQCYIEEETKEGERKWATIHKAKINELECLLEETNGKPMLILYEFKHDLIAIQELLKSMGLGQNAESITGVTGKRFNKIVADFNTGALQFMLAHAGSLHGLNIQNNCRHMTWYGIPWNLENYIQAVWRLYRQGENMDTVMCYHIVAQDTLDEKVMEVLIDKAATQDMVENLLKGEE